MSYNYKYFIMPPAMDLSNSNKDRVVSRYGKGRGIGRSFLSSEECLCQRPHCNLICHLCGYVGWGRLRYTCPKHPQTIFLIDMSMCPRCRSYAFMMSEVRTC